MGVANKGCRGSRNAILKTLHMNKDLKEINKWPCRGLAWFRRVLQQIWKQVQRVSGRSEPRVRVSGENGVVGDEVRETAGLGSWCQLYKEMKWYNTDDMSYDRYIIPYDRSVLLLHNKLSPYFKNFKQQKLISQSFWTGSSSIELAQSHPRDYSQAVH